MEDELEVVRNGLCQCLVCTNIKSKRKIEQLTNQKNITGLDHGWKITKEDKFPNGQPHPIACDNKPKTHKHYLLVC